MTVLQLAMVSIRLVGFVGVVALAVGAWRSIIVTIVQPRSASSHITWFTWHAVNHVFGIVARRLPRYEQKDALLALLAPEEAPPRRSRLAGGHYGISAYFCRRPG